MRFVPSAFAPLPAARVAAAIVVALSIGFVAGSSAAAATMAAGALLTGIPTVVAPRRISIAGVLAITAAMALSVFVGSATGELGWVHTAFLIPWCFAAGLLMGQPAAAMSVGSQAVAAMIVFGRFAEPPLGAAELTGYAVASSAIAIGVLGVTRTPLSGKDQRASLAAVLAALADLAAGQGAAAAASRRPRPSSRPKGCSNAPSATRSNSNGCMHCSPCALGSASRCSGSTVSSGGSCGPTNRRASHCAMRSTGRSPASARPWITWAPT